MKPKGGGAIPSELEKRIVSDFGSVDKFKEDFIQAGVTQFGSGWAWLAIDNGKLVVTKSANASNPLVDNMKPILGCDVCSSQASPEDGRGSARIARGGSI